MTGLEAIFFDFDGVLIDSEPVHWACWHDVLVRLGVNLSWDFYRDHCIGVDDREMLKWMAGDNRDWRDLWAQYPAKKQCFRARMIDNPPFPSTLPALLDRLEPKYRLAVVSSSSCEEIEPLLEKAGLRNYFGTVVGGGDVQHQKPDPEPYRLAATRLGVTRAVVLEDSKAGMAAGRAAGFDVIQVRHPNDVPALLADY
jgi:beta-phosphoglucomutase